MAEIDSEKYYAQVDIIVRAIRHLTKSFEDDVIRHVGQRLLVTPQEVIDFQQRLTNALDWVHSIRREAIQNSQSVLNESFQDADYELIKSALLHFRRDKANEIETSRQLTFNREIIDALDAKIGQIDILLQSDTLKVDPARHPELTDYVPITVAKEILGSATEPQPRAYDQKFKTLLSPDLIYNDIEFFREECRLRKLPLSLVFLDIDNFKKFSTNYGHSRVDVDLLPQFQHTIEAHTYQKGYAYQEGGDEYLLLLPNRNCAPFFVAETGLRI